MERAPQPSRQPVIAAGDPAARVASLRGLALFRDVRPGVIEAVVAAGRLQWLAVPRDTVIDPPSGTTPAVCIIVHGQSSLGVFDTGALDDRGPVQRDAAQGEQDGTLMPPGPLARAAKHNIALFGAGEVFNLVSRPASEERISAFLVGATTVVILTSEAMEELARSAPELQHAMASTLELTNARLRSVTGVKRELLDFYIRHGIAVAGPVIRVRQLDLCID